MTSKNRVSSGHQVSNYVTMVTKVNRHREKKQVRTYHIHPRGAGVLGISSDGDDRMELKVKTQKIP